MRPVMSDGPRRWMPVALLAGFAALVIGWPAAGVLISAARAGPGDGKALPVSFGPALLIESLAWAGLIAALAVALGWPMAWAARRWGWRAGAVLMAPMLLPPYLSYAGWNLLRAPDTWVGAWLERAAAEGHRWAPIAAGRVLAVAGLALWAAPIAAMALAVVARRVDDEVLDQLALDAGPRTLRHRARLLLSGIVAAFLFVGLLMLGSAVPLHLAQVPTWSITLWKGLDLTPPGEHWRLWLRAWPLMWCAFGGVAVLGVVLRPAAAWSEPRPGPGRGGASALALAAPVLGVGVPLVLFAVNLRSAASLATFWRVSGEAVADGLIVAGGVAAVSMGLVVVVWAAAARRSRGWALGVVAILAVAALLPGVLVGSAVARAWDGVGAVRDSAALVVLAHLARFAAVAGLAGVWLRVTEPREAEDARMVDGVAGLWGRRGWWGWWAACWPGQRGVIVGAGLAAGVLSFFEIESAIVVQPAAMQNLSRQILGYLHFARTEEFSAAAVMLMTAGLAVAAGAAWLAAGWPARGRRGAGGPPVGGR